MLSNLLRRLEMMIRFEGKFAGKYQIDVDAANSLASTYEASHAPPATVRKVYSTLENNVFSNSNIK